jgi:uncharacterized protein YybS (DUF2232 family)
MESTETSSESQTLEKGEVSGIPAGSSTGNAPGSASGSAKDGKPVLAPWWVRIVPYFLSAFFFLSAIFAVFAPLPLLLLRFRSGRIPAWAAVATNAAIVGLAAGRLSLAVYGIFVAALALMMGELIERRKSVEKITVLTLLTVALCGAVLVAWHSHIHHVNPIQEFRQEVSSSVDFLQASLTQGNAVSPEDAEEWKQSFLLEFPSALAVFALILVWANLSILLRVNPGGIRERMGLDAGFIRNWKAPELLIWPTIISGFFLVVSVGKASDVALNVFRFLMAIYAIQGLSILSFFFDVWKFRGFFRTVGFVVAIFLMMPLLLSLGFFDLWFDFRSKFRQS